MFDEQYRGLEQSCLDNIGRIWYRRLAQSDDLISSSYSNRRQPGQVPGAGSDDPGTFRIDIMLQ